MSRIKKILVANRGEIAVRIIQTAKKLGIKTIAIYAADDSDSMHVRLADQAVLLLGSRLSETYLNQDRIIEIAQKFGAEAIHPGYGFLSENAEFAGKTELAGLIFIGATTSQIKLMGEKTQAIAFACEQRIPVIPGIWGSADQILEGSKKLGFPLLVKASGGGGGKGMEVVCESGQLPQALEKARRQARQYFGNEELFVEKYLPKARHIEVQVLGDGKGNAVHFFERECSIQRRYQKLIEEAPACSISQKTKGKLYDAALRITQATQYRGAGTIEFLVDENEDFYFLEMNTRLQVEHPVTESITGVDLVEMQLRIASGEEIPFKQLEITSNGHAIELRICAEDPLQNFIPTAGTIGEVDIPINGRWDSFIRKGIKLSSSYDSLLGKLVVWGKTREEALRQLKLSVNDLFVEGIKTNQEFLTYILDQNDFINNKIHTRWVEKNGTNIIQAIQTKDVGCPVVELLAGYLLHHFYRGNKQETIWTQTGYWRLIEQFVIQVGQNWYEVEVRRETDRLVLIYEGTAYNLNDCQFSGQKIKIRLNNKDIIIFISEEDRLTRIQYQSHSHELRSNKVLNQVQMNRKESLSVETKVDKVVADLFGKVVDVLVKPGDVLRKGQNLLIIESMKSEFIIQSPVDAVVKNIHVAKGNLIQDKELLVDLES